MKFVCLRESLVDAINTVSKAVSPRSVLTVIEGIYIKTQENNTLKLVGNDLEIGIETEISAEVEHTGSIVLNAKMFGDIIKRLPGSNVEIEVKENKVTTVISGQTRFEISGIDSSEFPDLPKFNPDHSIILTRKSIKDMINHTKYAVSVNQSKPVLTGCLLEVSGEVAKMVAVDGYRMAVREIKLDTAYEDKSVIIPSKALNELDKILKDEDEKITLNYTSNHAVFEFDTCKLVTRLIEGEYINYKQIIPKENSITLRCATAEVINSVERVALVITNEINKSHIKLKIEDNNINVSCETNMGRAEDNIVVETGGKDLEIGFNHKFLLDALKACDTPEVMLRFNESVTPCTVVPVEGDAFMHLLLPIRLKAD